MRNWIGLGLIVIGASSCSDGLLVEVGGGAASRTLDGMHFDVAPARVPVATGQRSLVSRGAEENETFSRSERGRLLPGTWEGEIRGQSFASGSNRLRLVIDEPLGAGPNDGYFVFGEGEPPERPRVEEQFPLAHYAGRPLDQTLVFDGVWEGFRYPATLRMVDFSFSFSIFANSFDLFEQWCGLRTVADSMSKTCVPRTYPVPVGDGVQCRLYALDRYLEVAGAAPEVARAPCFEADICLNRCACDDERCGAWQVGDIQLIGTLDGAVFYGDLHVSWPPMTASFQLNRMVASEEALP